MKVVRISFVKLNVQLCMIDISVPKNVQLIIRLSKLKIF